MEVFACGDLNSRYNDRGGKPAAIFLLSESDKRQGSNRKLQRSASFPVSGDGDRERANISREDVYADRRFSDGELAIPVGYFSSKLSCNKDINDNLTSQSLEMTEHEAAAELLLHSEGATVKLQSEQRQEVGECWKVLNSGEDLPTLKTLRGLLYLEKSDEERQLLLGKCMEAVKNELSFLTNQDKLLMKQFVKLQGNISKIKSCIEMDESPAQGRVRGHSFHSRTRKTFTDPKLRKRTSWFC